MTTRLLVILLVGGALVYFVLKTNEVHMGENKFLSSRPAARDVPDFETVYRQEARKVQAVMEETQRQYEQQFQQMFSPAAPTQSPNYSAALLHAAQEGDVETVQQLLTEGADVESKDSSGQTPLALAARANQLEIVQMLLEAGADKEAKGYGNVTPLGFAVYRGHTEIVETLVAAGAEVNVLAAVEFGSEKPLLFHAVQKDHLEVMEILLKAGADANLRDRFGQTSLHYAAVYRDTSFLEPLLEAGADVDLKDYDGETPLDLAMKNRKSSNANLLREFQTRKPKMAEQPQKDGVPVAIPLLTDFQNEKE